jgi:hypothetical protein
LNANAGNIGNINTEFEELKYFEKSKQRKITNWKERKDGNCREFAVI